MDEQNYSLQRQDFTEKILKYNIMAFCQRLDSNNSSPTHTFENQVISKYSLRDRCFRQKKNGSQKKSNTDSNSLMTSRFAEFISNHNNALLTRAVQKEDKKPKERSLFDCYQSANAVLLQENVLEKKKISNRMTISTSSSSSVSEKRRYNNQNSNFLDESVPAFRINTKSIISQLLKDNQNREQTGDLSIQDEGSFHIDLYSSRIIQKSIIKTSGRNSSRKSNKKSLKNENNLPNLNQLNFKKNSLLYNQLSDNLHLGSALKTPTNQSAYLQQSINFGSQMRSSEKKQTQKLGCNCFSECECKWIRRWMKKIGHRQAYIPPQLMINKKELTQIDKDVPRTQLSNIKIRKIDFQGRLRDILVNYTVFRPHIGYLQGMNVIAGAIVVHNSDISKSTAIFNYLMIDRKFEKIYQNDLILGHQLSRHLSQQIHKYSQTLYSHFINNDICLEMFVHTWYFTMLGSFVPQTSMPYIIDKFLTKGFLGLNQIILTLLIYLKQQLLQSDYSELMQKLSTSWLLERSKKIDWFQLVECSENVMLRPLLL